MKIQHLLTAVPLCVVAALAYSGCSSPTKATHFADEQWASANLVRGAQLYDKWWSINGATSPTADFDPIWSTQTTNLRTGGDTWRCKECHGWDYQGKDGAYATGSHMTGFIGVWSSRLGTHANVFDSIKDEGGDHDLSAELSDQDVLDLAKFIIDGLIDVSLYIDGTKQAVGDTLAGQTLYASNCATCHGADGTSLDFDPAPGVQGVGWLANDNPYETLHKIRWGHPGSVPQMPSMVASGLTDQQTGDILAYAQKKLPQ